MALIPYSFFPRSMFDMNQWTRPYDYGVSTMDLFDPFDQLDSMLGRNFLWLNKPEFLTQQQTQQPKYPQKYRITVDCAGYDPKLIKTEVKGGKFIVSGREEHKVSGDDYSTKDFKKTYDLPQHAEFDKFVSFMTPQGNLIVEFPLKETAQHPHTDLFPKIIDQNGNKLVTMNFTIPENIDPSKVTVSIKDRDLIFKAEDKVDKQDAFSRFYYYKRTTLPETTDFDHLKCNYEKGRISVQAPLRTDYKTMNLRNIPIDYKGYPYQGYPYQGYQQCQQYPYQQQIGQAGFTGQKY